MRYNKGSISPQVQRRLDLHNQGMTTRQIANELNEDYRTAHLSIVRHIGYINPDKLGRKYTVSNRLALILATTNGRILDNEQLAERLGSTPGSIAVLKHRLRNKELLPANNPSP